MNTYLIRNAEGNEVNRIVADEAFVESVYPGLWEDLGPVEAPVVEKPFRSIDKVEAIALLTTITGMDNAQELAFRKDPNLELFWIKWKEDVGNVIHRDNPLTETILNALEATGYLNAQTRQAVLDNWPRQA